ncbi:MAG: HD domain-containing protein [Candidatus Anstonellaceae archaeon]
MNEKKITIRDPIHGEIDLFEHEAKIIDLEIFQRLRNIKQVGLSYLVYPGAHHTRFEHSLGSLFLAQKFAIALDLKKEERYLLRLVALLHDLGHLGFSHDSEAVLIKNLKLNHEDLTKEFVLNSDIIEIVEDNGFNKKKLLGLLDGKDIGKLISFDVGADRLDYLLRDAYYTGVAYGIIEWERVISTTKWVGEPIIEFGGIEAAESVILARFSMFHTVYYHHAIRIARAMFQKALELAIKNKEIGLEELKKFGDLELLFDLRNNESSRTFVDSILKRKLFKRAFVQSWEKLNKKQKEFAKTKLIAELEEEFGSDALAIFPESFSSTITLKAEDGNNKIYPFKVLSPLTASLIKTSAKRANLLICAKKEIVEKVKKKCQMLFKL